ncbi:unnamed protein product, partial [Urochloa humidicola]
GSPPPPPPAPAVRPRRLQPCRRRAAAAAAAVPRRLRHDRRHQRRRDGRRLGPPHHLRVLSDIPADAPNAAADDYYDMPTDAPAPVAVAVDRPSLRPRHYPRVPTCRRAGIVKGAEMLASTVAGLYAASKTAHEKATRVRPLGQDAVEAAGH